MKKVYLFILALILNCSAFTQEIGNIRVSQTGNRINILFDLSGIGQATRISLFYSNNDGQTWNGPLKFLHGDTNNLPIPSIDRRIIWDALSELGDIVGELRFKVIADFTVVSVPSVETIMTKSLSTDKPWKNDPEFKKHRNAGSIWLITTLASAGIGGRTLMESIKTQNEYQKALNIGIKSDINELEGKKKSLDVTKVFAFGSAGLSAALFILQSSNKSKVRNRYKAQPITMTEGGGIILTYYF